MENNGDVELGGRTNADKSLSFIARLRNAYRAKKRRNLINFHVNRLKDMTMIQIIQDRIASIVFQKYLINEYPQEEMSIRNPWECYMLAREICWNTQLLRDGKVADRILQLCPPILWEHEIMEAINLSHNHMKSKFISQKMNKLMTECVMEMETNSGYHDFLLDLAFKREKIIQYLEQFFEEKEYFNLNKISV